MYEQVYNVENGFCEFVNAGNKVIKYSFTCVICVK